MREGTIHWGLLRGFRFDAFFILGIAGAAILTGLLVARMPQLFATVLFLDLWLLSYHHVIATFTRIGFDAASVRAHRVLVLVLPVLVVVATIAAVMAVGQWVITTVYFYWQWLHYTRQSYGVSRIYQLKAAAGQDRQDVRRDRLSTYTLYLVAIAGVLHRSAEGWTHLLGFELRMIPVPWWMAHLAAGVAAGAVILWAARQVRDAARGTLQGGYTLYLASHIVIFGVGYFGVSHIVVGWLVVNIWHNAQYLVLVWMYNNNRFQGGVAAGHRFLSWISQRGRWPLYVGSCLLITAAFYGILDRAAALLAVSTLPMMLIAYQTINFHHYIVDSVIWKVRKKPVREALGIAA